jgi:hypothetical protein
LVRARQHQEEVAMIAAFISLAFISGMFFLILIAAWLIHLAINRKTKQAFQFLEGGSQ